METYEKQKESLRGKTILLRVDFNVPLKDSTVASDFRLRRTLPTIKDLQEAGARIILIAHIENKEGSTLEPIARYMVADFPRLYFVKDIFDQYARELVKKMKDGDIVLFENLRKWPGEKENDGEFAKHLASFADIYINEAFSASHRPHASIVGIPKLLPSFIGLAFAEEVKHLSLAFNPHKPFLFVLGGAKFETKIPLLERFLEIADLVAVGGAIANDFFKAKGYFVGDSLVSDTSSEDIHHLLQSTKLMLPIDVYTSHKGEKLLKSPTQVGVGEKIMDVGDKTVKMLKHAVAESNFVLWNGPLGKSESGFGGGTEAFAKIVANSKIVSIVGGGDVVASIEGLNLMKKFTFVSSGGGAMLDFLADETLPGIEAIKHANHRIVSKDASDKTFLNKMWNKFRK